jgi:DNA invertase Pin-like site-specific DNA recombinase
MKMTKKQFVAYLRVSTSKQGDSGLGLEAQRAAITAYLNGGKWEVLAEFIEIESGKRNDRPKLAEAMRLCRKKGATLVIAKLDRLARNVHFVSGLMESKVDFVACDNPTANKLTIHILAAVAEDEAVRISARTKAALAAAKARGTVLGGRRVSKRRLVEIGDAARQARSLRVNAERGTLRLKIKKIQDEGATTLRAIASALNEQRVDAPRGGEWSAVQVQRVLASVSA